MAPQEKTTIEQREYLWSLMDDYLEVQKQGNFTKFWARLFLAWFKLWPEEEDASIQDEKQRQVAYALAIKEQESYLRTWFRGRAASKNRTPHGAPMLDVAKLPKATRCLQEVEIYSKKYYATRVAYLVKATFVGKPAPTTKELLKMRRKITQAALNNETPEIKEEISSAHKEALRVRGEQKQVQKEDREPTAECYAAGIKSIEPNFNAFAQRVGLDSGWSLTLITGGPDPMNAGRIRTASFHYGFNVFGHVFSQHDPDFKEKFLPSYANFLQTCYSPEECQSRALNPVSPVPKSPPSASPLGALPDAPPVSVPLSEASPSEAAPTPEVPGPPKVAKGKATKTVKPKPKASKASTEHDTPADAASDAAPATTKPKASKASTEHDTPASDATSDAAVVASDAAVVASDAAVVASNTAVVASNAAVVASNAAVVASDASAVAFDQGAAWSLANGLGTFPLLPPDLNFLNDPANFPNAFPLFSNVHMPSTIPTMPVVPPPDPYMSLLDELKGPLPANFSGATDQINTCYLTTNAMYPTMAPSISTAPPLSYPYTALAVIPNTVDSANAFNGPNVNSPNAVDNAGTERNTDIDVPSTGGSATVANNTNMEDTGTVSKSTTRAPRKRRREEIDPKFIVEGKRVRRQQVRTEIEALTHKAGNSND